MTWTLPKLYPVIWPLSPQLFQAILFSFFRAKFYLVTCRTSFQVLRAILIIISLVTLPIKTLIPVRLELIRFLTCPTMVRSSLLAAICALMFSAGKFDAVVIAAIKDANQALKSWFWAVNRP